MSWLHRPALFASQIFFSVITPPLLVPQIAKLRVTRSLVSFCFGRSYGGRYQNVIDAFQGRYGLAMTAGLSKAAEMAADRISIVADCGTGTGFALRQAAAYFPHAAFVALDILAAMLVQARDNCSELAADVLYLQADSFTLPLDTESVDLVLAQNTIPCFAEFARVCRPGGMILYADSSAGWIAGLAKRRVEKQQPFDRVLGGRVDLGFYVLARKKTDRPDRPRLCC